MRITWAPVALERIEEIAREIATGNPPAAEAWVHKLFDRAERLKNFPESGAIIPEAPNGPYRQILHGDYRVVYRVEGKRVFVLTVRHGRRTLDPTERV